MFELLISHTSQTFLRINNTEFVENLTKTFLSADIPLYKLNNKHIKNLFHDIGHSFPSKTACTKTVLQLSVDDLEQIRNGVPYVTSRFFWLQMRALYLHTIFTQSI